MVIVTNRCFLLCDEILAMTLQSQSVAHNSPIEPGFIISSSTRSRNKCKKKSTVKTVEPEVFNIQIIYRPKIKGSSSYADLETLNITLYGLDEAKTTFQRMVSEIREQMPDEVFLDDIVTRLLLEESAGGPAKSTSDEVPLLIDA